jgi:hypothetical protein
MHPLHWIYVNREFLQSLGSLTTALLTICLIILNGIYVRANWKTMRLMEADVRFRLKPIPHLGLEFIHPPKGDVHEFYLTLRAEHAPMCLIALDLNVAVGRESTAHTLTFNQEIVDNTTISTKTYGIKLPGSATAWLATLFYRDLSGFLDYATHFNEKGFVGEGTTVNRHTLYNRTRFRMLRLWRRKEMSRLMGSSG